MLELKLIGLLFVVVIIGSIIHVIKTAVEEPNFPSDQVGEKLEIDYENAHGDFSVCSIKPQNCYVKDGMQYVDAMMSDGSERTFRMNRVSEARSWKPQNKFTTPGEIRAALKISARKNTAI